MDVPWGDRSTFLPVTGMFGNSGFSMSRIGTFYTYFIGKVNLFVELPKPSAVVSVNEHGLGESVNPFEGDGQFRVSGALTKHACYGVKMSDRIDRIFGALGTVEPIEVPIVYEGWKRSHNECAMEYVREVEFQKLLDEIDDFWGDSTGNVVTPQQFQLFFYSLLKRGFSLEQMNDTWKNLKHFVLFAQASPEKSSIEDFEGWELSCLVFEFIPRKFVGPELNCNDIRDIFGAIKLLYDYFKSEGWTSTTRPIDDVMSIILGNGGPIPIEPSGIDAGSTAFSLNADGRNVSFTYRDLWLLLVWAKDFDADWNKMYLSLDNAEHRQHPIVDASKKLFRGNWLGNELKKNSLVPELFFHSLCLGVMHFKAAKDWFYHKPY